LQPREAQNASVALLIRALHLKRERTIQMPFLSLELFPSPNGQAQRSQGIQEGDVPVPVRVGLHKKVLDVGFRQSQIKAETEIPCSSLKHSQIKAAGMALAVRHHRRRHFLGLKVIL
jgi:hypothetical protein